MWKQLIVLARGRRFEAVEAVVDRNALALLRQQIRECAAVLATAHREVAVVVAQGEQEARRRAAVQARVEDLEGRTLAALEQDKPGLAREGAEAIGRLEAERDAAAQAAARFDTEAARLKRVLADARERLDGLQRGLGLATAADRVERLRVEAPGTSLSTLEEAEATLERLRSRQTLTDAASAAFDAIGRDGDAAAVSEKLAASGCGAPSPRSADAVLARLAARAGCPS